MSHGYLFPAKPDIVAHLIVLFCYRSVPFLQVTPIIHHMNRRLYVAKVSHFDTNPCWLD